MGIVQSVNLDVLALAAFCLINLGLIAFCLVKLRNLKQSNRSLRRRVHDLEDDIKVLFSTTSNMGEQLKSIQHTNKILREQQEQLSLKEPSQQSYRNAIQQIRSGETTNKIVETSGLSRGEVELLRILNASESGKSVVES